MNPAEVVVHVVERNRVLQVFSLLAERIRQAREAAHRHTHREILALNVGRGNVVVVRRTSDDGLACSHANRRTVAHVRTFWGCAVNLLQHPEINVGSEYIFNRMKVCLVAVRRKLDAVREAVFQIGKKMKCAARVMRANEPARNKFGVRTKSNPRPKT